MSLLITVALALQACVIPPIPRGGESGASNEPIHLGQVETKPAKSSLFTASELPAPASPISAEQCDQLEHGGSTKGCITADISCGESIIGHTRGGSKQFDSEFYKKKFCTPNTTNHDGGDERIYRLRMPEGPNRAFVTLDTPCADLDVAAMLWNEPGCPNIGHVVNRCEMQPKPSTKREQLELVSQHESTWLIVVEGKNSEEGAFALSVECAPGLH